MIRATHTAGDGRKEGAKHIRTYDTGGRIFRDLLGYPFLEGIDYTVPAHESVMSDVPPPKLCLNKECTGKNPMKGNW